MHTFDQTFRIGHLTATAARPIFAAGMKKALLGHILLWCFFMGMGSTWMNVDRVMSLVSQRMAHAYSENAANQSPALHASAIHGGSYYDVAFAEKAEEDKFPCDPSTDSLPPVADIFNTSVWETVHNGPYVTSGSHFTTSHQTRHVLLRVFLI